MENKSSLDILGLKPIGDAVNTGVEKSFQGLEGFLKSVCLPALDEIGLLLKDKVRHWRLCNILNIMEKAKGKLDFQGESLQIKSHPRIALSIIENGSLNDNDEIQELWAGLFTSSCTEDGQDDENLIFVDLLKQLTVAQARILKFSCESSRKILYKNGLVVGDDLEADCNLLIELTKTNNIHRIDRELDHLRSLELIHSAGGFKAASEELIANITPTALALNLYIKSQGYNINTADYFKHSLVTAEQVQKEKQELHKIEMEKQKIEAEKRRQEEIIIRQGNVNN
ncbi:Abi-alpha family protein [Flavobacterium sp. LB3P122]|uniref:Abi-alpha family protein n=1 Tax=Flavobacterium algoriphilum TaxID=3398738 RepID=UPI003A87BABA